MCGGFVGDVISNPLGSKTPDVWSEQIAPRVMNPIYHVDPMMGEASHQKAKKEEEEKRRAIEEAQRAAARDQSARNWAASGGLGEAPPSTKEGAEAAVREMAGNTWAATNQKLSPYPGSAPVGPSAETLQAQQMVMDLQPGLQTNAANLQTALNTALTAPDVNNNPALRGAIDAAIRPLTERTYNAGGVMSQIRGGAQMAGSVGSSRQGIAEGLAAKGYMDALTDTTAKMTSDAYTHGLDTMVRGMATAPTVMNAQLAPAQAVSSVGQQKEAYQTDVANYDTDKKLWDINAPWQNVGNYANIVYGNPATVLPGQTNDPRMPARQRNLTLLGMGVGGAVGGVPGAMLGGTAGNLFSSFL